MLLAKLEPEPQAEDEAPPAEAAEEPKRRKPAADAGEESKVAAVLGSSVFRSFARSAASAAGREISRSLFGTAPRRRRSTRRRR